MAPVAALLGIDILPPVFRRRCCCFTAPLCGVHEFRARSAAAGLANKADAKGAAVRAALRFPIIARQNRARPE
jgi:hypothetical protein